MSLPLFFAIFCSFSATAQSWETRPNLLSPGAFGGDIDVATEKGVWALAWQGDFMMYPWAQSPTNQFSRAKSNGQGWVTGTYPASADGAYSSNIHARGVSHALIAANDNSWGPKVYETKDGGTTWADLNVGLTTRVRFVHFFSQNHGIAVGEQDANHEFEIFTTQDGGVTWGRSNTAGIANAYSTEKLTNDLYTADGIDIWFATSSKRIFHSADRGLTWNYFWAPQNIAPSALAVQNGKLVIAFTTYDADGSLGYHKCKMYRTSNAATGGGWTNITPGDGEFATESVVYIPGTTTLVGAFRTNNSSGFSQMISYDEGANWQVFSGANKVFRVDFKTSTLGWGSEYKLNDAGAVAYKFKIDAFAANTNNSNMLQEANVDTEITQGIASTLRVWPNPTTDNISIQLDNLEVNDATVVMYDAMGRQVRQIRLADEQTQASIAVADLPAG